MIDINNLRVGDTHWFRNVNLWQIVAINGNIFHFKLIKGYNSKPLILIRTIDEYLHGHRIGDFHTIW